MAEAARHRRDGLPRLARRGAAGGAGPRGRRAVARAAARGPRGPRPVRVDAGDPAIRDLVAGCDAVLHFAGVPRPGGRARATPPGPCARTPAPPSTCSRAARSTAPGSSTPRPCAAAVDPPPDPYALSKRLGENVCRLHPAPADGRAAHVGVRPRPARGRAPPARSPWFAAQGARGRADRDPGGPAPRTRLRLRGRRRRRARADRRRRDAGTRP